MRILQVILSPTAATLPPREEYNKCCKTYPIKRQPTTGRLLIVNRTPSRTQVTYNVTTAAHHILKYFLFSLNFRRTGHR